MVEIPSQRYLSKGLYLIARMNYDYVESMPKRFLRWQIQELDFDLSSQLKPKKGKQGQKANTLTFLRPAVHFQIPPKTENQFSDLNRIAHSLDLSKHRLELGSLPFPLILTYLISPFSSKDTLDCIHEKRQNWMCTMLQTKNSYQFSFHSEQPTSGFKLCLERTTLKL